MSDAAAAAADDAVDPDAAADDDAPWREATVDAALHGRRLDQALAAIAPEFSRSHLQGLVALGHARVDGAVATGASRRLRAGQRVAVRLVPTAASRSFRAEPMALSIVHEDAHLLVVDKPAGLVVHPAAGNWSGTLLNGLLAHHPHAATLPRAGIVHRLDKDTSGLMVVAKTLPAAVALVRAIAAREVDRRYVAIAHGAPAWSSLAIDAPIGRDPASRVRMAVGGAGRPARTDVDLVASARVDGRPVAALRCRLHSGRTHQIRVHLASRGHPLVADATYGGAVPPSLGLARQALHAARLAFAHPADGTVHEFFSPLPADLHAAWRRIEPSLPADAGEAAAAILSAHCGGPSAASALAADAGRAVRR